ncbi:uncharacterized protein [Nicotiana sylvestris]|uniref:uncharacterized protein n=1 Tax=Nicotiana sylvestris TaxID=4096 RepID=UPI00388C8BD0
MEEDDMVKYFLQAMDPTYYGHLISAIGKSFNDVVNMGEIVEEGLKSSKIMSYSAIKATTQAIQSGTGSLLGKKKKEDVAMVVSGSWHGHRGSPYQFELKIPNPHPKNLDYSLRCAYCSDAPGHDIEKCWHLKRAIQELIDTNQIVVQSPDAPNINQNPLPAHEKIHIIEIVHNDGEPKKYSKSIMMIRASESNLVKAPNSNKAKPLTVEGAKEKPSSLYLKPLVLVVKGPSKDIGASLESSKVVVPGILSKPVIVVKGAHITPVIIKLVTQMPVVDAKAIPWNYKQVIVTYKGKEIKEEVSETGGLTRSGRCFTPEELRKTKPFKDSQMPVKKSVTEEEAEEFLKKMKVQDYSIVEQLRKTPAQISLLSLLIHSDEHRRVLMKILNEAHVPNKIIVNHLEKIASKIFEVNKITFSDDELAVEGTKHNRALYLTIGTERIHLNIVCVRGFDGGGKDSVGDIMLELSIGPVEFTMKFQVLDVAVSYNLLLGRPWIHAAKVVPSSLHQMVKFEWDMQEIVVHGDEDLSACNDTIVPFIEAEDDKRPWVIRLSKQYLLTKFLKENAFRGIVHPVHPSRNPGTFGLGFMPIEKDVKRVKNMKQKGRKTSISSIPKLVVDVDEELIKRFQSLFEEVNMVEVGKGSGKADVQLIGPNVNLSNWKATPLPTRKEF